MTGNPVTKRSAIRYYAGARMVAGAAMFAAPRVVGRAWIGSEGAPTEVSIITRSFAVRDVGIGIGTLRATSNGLAVHDWLQVSLLADLGDLVSALWSSSSKRRAPLIALAAAGVAADVVCLWWGQKMSEPGSSQ